MPPSALSFKPYSALIVLFLFFPGVQWISKSGCAECSLSRASSHCCGCSPAVKMGEIYLWHLNLPITILIEFLHKLFHPVFEWAIWRILKTNQTCLTWKTAELKTIRFQIASSTEVSIYAYNDLKPETALTLENSSQMVSAQMACVLSKIRLDISFCSYVTFRSPLIKYGCSWCFKEHTQYCIWLTALFLVCSSSRMKCSSSFPSMQPFPRKKKKNFSFIYSIMSLN